VSRGNITPFSPSGGSTNNPFILYVCICVFVSDVRRSLLFAAYSVAVSANDAEYFAEILCDLGHSLQTAEGRMACEAQDEVLQVCDQLYLANKLTENQLLYLRHLVLIRDSNIADIYDDYQKHEHTAALAKALYDLANTHPYSSSLANTTTDRPSSGAADTERHSLKTVVHAMLQAGNISGTEASFLLQMAQENNEYVSAAYELYEHDGNVEDLQDTLTRCVKLEIRRRQASLQESQLQAQQTAQQQLRQTQLRAQQQQQVQ
jgi:hypothetical protein